MARLELAAAFASAKRTVPPDNSARDVSNPHHYGQLRSYFLSN
jgi:hypothetical protein